MYKIGVIGIGIVGKAIIDFYMKHVPKLWVYDKYKNVGSIEHVLDNARIIYVSVPTPFGDDGYILKELESVLKQLSQIAVEKNRAVVVLLKSTVLPGTTDYYSELFPYLNIIYNPEFLSKATASMDFKYPKQIILGKSTKCPRDIYKSIVKIHKKFWPDTLISETNAVNAECTKVFLNNFYAVKIQFCNELWFLVKSLQINNNYKCDYKKIMELMLANGWINPMHTRVPGTDGLLSFGGGCFPKDTRALLKMMKNYSPYSDILEAVVKEQTNIRK